MRLRIKLISVVLIALLAMNTAKTEIEAPFGRATPPTASYKAQKVVYDVGANDRAEFSFLLDRVSFLKNLYQADPFDTSIVLVLHGNEIPLFAISDYKKNSELMARAHSLSIDGIVEFRVCAQAAKAHGLQHDDMHGFVKIVEMADAEIIQLQQDEGYVYMQ